MGPATTLSLVTSKGMLFFYINFSKIWINFLDDKTISIKNVVSGEVLDLVKHYNFDVDLFSI